MKILKILLLLSLCLSQAIIAQISISGNVIDAQTQEPIPYVNIGIVKLMKGTVSDDSGTFKLGYDNETDTVTFSAIGYKAQKRSIQELLKNQEVMLSPFRYELEEITVSEQALGNLKTMGYNLKKRGQSVGFGSTQLGTEIGALIEIDRETIIYEAHFTFNNVSEDSLLFRVNVYQMKGQKPSKNLIPENIIVAAPKEPGTISVDLSSYHIVTEQDVLLSLEWVKAVSVKKNEIQGVSIRADRSRRNPNAWFRSTSLAPFIKMDQFVNYHLGFYISARQVKK